MKKLGYFALFAAAVYLIAAMTNFAIDVGTQAMNDPMHPACKAFSGHCDEGLFMTALMAVLMVLFGVCLMVFSLSSLVGEIIPKPRKAVGDAIAYILCGICATVAFVTAGLMTQFGWYMFQSDLVGMWGAGIATSAVFAYLTFGDSWLQDAVV